MKKIKNITLRLGTLFLIAMFLLFLGLFVGLPSYMISADSSAVSRALRGAHSVTVTEFVSYFDTSGNELVQREIVLHSVTASPDQISQFHRATSGFLDVGFPPTHKRCFDPHHRVEVIRADGITFRFDVCFLCSNASFGDGGIQTIPSAWLPRLEQFFSTLGMPPRTSDEYAKLRPKDA